MLIDLRRFKKLVLKFGHLPHVFEQMHCVGEGYFKVGKPTSTPGDLGLQQHVCNVCNVNINDSFIRHRVLNCLFCWFFVEFSTGLPLVSYQISISMTILFSLVACPWPCDRWLFELMMKSGLIRPSNIEDLKSRTWYYHAVEHSNMPPMAWQKQWHFLIFDSYISRPRTLRDAYRLYISSHFMEFSNVVSLRSTTRSRNNTADFLQTTHYLYSLTPFWLPRLQLL